MYSTGIYYHAIIFLVCEQRTQQPHTQISHDSAHGGVCSAVPLICCIILHIYYDDKTNKQSLTWDLTNWDLTNYTNYNFSQNIDT